MKPTQAPASPPPRDAGYGVVEYTDQPGRRRFACWGDLPESAITELCAVARKWGARPTDTSSFIKQSIPH